MFFVTFKCKLTAIGFDFNNYDIADFDPATNTFTCDPNKWCIARTHWPAQLAGKGLPESEPKPDADTDTCVCALTVTEHVGQDREHHDPEQRLRRRGHHQHRAQLATGNKTD